MEPYGHPPPQPPRQWGPPQPKKKSKLGWILGGIGIFVLILLFAGCSALVNSINGGGSHAEKAKAVMAAADNAPEGDWVLTHRSDPKVEAGCLSIDTACIKLRAEWRVDHPVSLNDVATRIGMDVSKSKLSEDGCIKENDPDGGGTDEVCIVEEEWPADGYRVILNMSRR
jgi:hypothetical protein